MRNPFEKHIRLKSLQGTRFVVKADLVYLKANGNYTDYYLYKNGEVERVSQCGHLKRHLKKINEDLLRISQSHAINLRFIEHIGNDRVVRLSVPVTEQLVVSKSYWKIIRPFL